MRVLAQRKDVVREDDDLVAPLLLVVADQELARLELVGVHHVQGLEQVQETSREVCMFLNRLRSVLAENSAQTIAKFSKSRTE
jgi:hypothetical protein